MSDAAQFTSRSQADDRVRNVLKWVLLAVTILSFGLFFWATTVTYDRAPPYGSLYGMGSYFGQDYTAFALMRLANLTEQELSQSQYGKAFESLSLGDKASVRDAMRYELQGIDLTKPRWRQVRRSESVCFVRNQLGATAQNRIAILRRYDSACLHSATGISSHTSAIYIFLRAALRRGAAVLIMSSPIGSSNEAPVPAQRNGAAFCRAPALLQREGETMVDLYGTFEIDAAIIADGLEIDASSVQQRMRDGTVTSRCERGIDSDEGRYRLTFFTERRRLRLIVDEAGKVLQRSTIDFGEHCATRPAGRHLRQGARWTRDH